MTAERALTRLIGQHPAAVRTVAWQRAPLGPTEIRHLELESKHGHVLVIDHVTGEVHQLPPAPPGATLARHQRDLTAEVPAAFDGRPRIESAVPLESVEQPTGWRFGLSTGACFEFHLDPESPRLTVTTPTSDPAPDA